MTKKRVSTNPPKNSLRCQSSKKTVTKTIENIRQDEENLYYAPDRSSGDGDDEL